ncbi:MAG: hypothetical protein ACHQIL_03135 [Steroidobacterales bacterium]
MTISIAGNRLRLSTRAALALAGGLLLATTSTALSCGAPLTSSILTVQRLLEVAPHDGAHSQRIKWSDADISWMHGELELIHDACSRGRDVEAAWRLEQVQLRMASAGNPGSSPLYRQLTASSRVAPTS